MNSFDGELNRRLDALRAQGLRRELRRVDSAQSPRIEIGGKPLLNFSSNDYLGLANHPALKEAAIRAIEKFGAGAGASRLISGSLAPHHDLEETLARFKDAEAALTFSTGYATALGTICALLGKDDVIILDKLVHASIVDAARLSGAKLRVFAHNDLDDLEQKLKWANARQLEKTGPNEIQPRILIVTESVFSMDGDLSPLREIIALKEKYDAWLMVDEAHATGLYGTHRRGLAEQLGVSNRIEIQMGTLGKALGASGGYIAGSRALVDYLINRARSFIFSTAPVPAAAAAANAAIQLVESGEGENRRNTLWERAKFFQSLRRSPDIFQSAIVPIILGEESRATAAADFLRAENIFVPAIRYPTVARGAARLRVALTTSHSAEEISRLAQSLEKIENLDSKV
ncbi:MAG TPA: pyridoxal phosphate-dependent aminotransferase family protein [Verrucomicrobiae bacterium]|nr:pyridoxal phosphate-dependent aminotransferase family protein [Verrucomicrobiae bacterium]